MSIGSYAGAVCGMVVAGTLDLLLTYASNLLFRARQEINADFFAARTCSDAELEEAAAFFESYEAIKNSHPEPGILAKVPSLFCQVILMARNGQSSYVVLLNNSCNSRLRLYNRADRVYLSLTY